MANMCFNIPSLMFTMMYIISRLMSIVGAPREWTRLLPHELQSLDLSHRMSFDEHLINHASTDFGNLVKSIPAAVLNPISIDDIVSLVRFSYNSQSTFAIAPRGHGHSIRGQAMAADGVVVDMRSLKGNADRIRVSASTEFGGWVDVGGEQLWIDVLHACLERGLAPKTWTDYLYLTVGGTLSNAGISGQTFLHGPQISNVLEMDVITGRGEMVTCNKHMNSDLFYAVLGGLGQFGIITRARIALSAAPKRVKWVRMLYHDFFAFTRDQEHLISIKGLDYLEGSVMMDQSPANNWRSSFFSPSDHPRVTSLASKHGVIYCLEVAKYYNHPSIDSIDEEMELLFDGLEYASNFKFKKDVSYENFLNRVRNGELELQKKGLWDVPHPWLNLFVPKSQISEFNSGVFEGILSKNGTNGPMLIYPMNKNKWDERTSAIIPDEEIFYTIGLLHSSGLDDWEYLEDKNKEILQYCVKAGIKVKQYLPHYKNKADWMNHFGLKWELFQTRKIKFDPKAILSPGQGIFN
ncbi:hypothetical protein Scep_024748 [Stephania cephalantha]|uniref:cytokinin dehydrogenase n=1 Tax=Stephania cephalantha TaxID=152367 RepID=A0AAP0F4E7_9MAGN